MSEFDVHEAAHLLQAEQMEVPSVHVMVDTPVRTEEMPTENAYGRNILGIGREPVHLLGDDPTRRRAILSIFIPSGTHFVCIGHTEGQARAYTGMLLFSPNAITRYELWDRKGIWVCPGLATTTANLISLGSSTSQMIITWSTEHWSR